ncbi:hypothetical protein AGABI1DRAFT_123068 [Agaricus bisporus var. burnettii JB137-S8]|uniref:Beta-lactamase-related domain-containing protein n=1 Tax=Agaricus bisporus var. burnettii (strain JB137-S8 / ATCC MYA-4627 / FGSC 10392) TaxID=597362 RepID=K5WYI2_AGABU|nr:uncharacterized protein AGABI1DRAFT_123068 [Agaricus bisporus var. burnettii JB137-S8]EKM75647.1 hypothetical protein AGABI1DRAFT_123068 [Agaricus bisporus var. burnettii JB137-S8]
MLSASLWIDEGLNALRELEENITGYTVPANYGSASFNQVRPLYPGAVALVANEGTVVSHFSTGYSYKYADADGTLSPQSELYVVASLTKMFTTILAMQQLDKGAFGLNDPVVTHLPGLDGGKEDVTVQMLMTHTSGFDADPDPGLWYGYPTVEERREAILRIALINEPGKRYLYSDINYMVLQLLLEQVTGKALDDLLKDDLTGPLNMTSTFFNRRNVQLNKSELVERHIVSTEYQIEVLGDIEPDRLQPVWGTVHDENAWGLDGVSGHAGLYSSALDLGVFCQMILNNGTFGGTRVLKPETVDLIFTNFNGAFPGNAHGLGFELNQNYWSGAMRSLKTAGHTGFTGTSLAIDRPSNTLWVLLTHRVHPSRTWSNINLARENMGFFVAKALGRIE